MSKVIQNLLNPDKIWDTKNLYFFAALSLIQVTCWPVFTCHHYPLAFKSKQTSKENIQKRERRQKLTIFSFALTRIYVPVKTFLYE